MVALSRLRRLILLATVVALALSACTAGGPAPAPTAGTATTSAAAGGSGGAVPVPADGLAYFGTQFGGTDDVRKAKITALEQRIGRQFAIDHVYYRWDEPFPSAYDRWTIEQGRTLFLNWSSRRADKSAEKWTDIAMGGADDLIRARAEAIKALGVPVFLGFTHEPNQLIGSGRNKSGEARSYVQAWRHIVQVFRDAGVTNVSWVWTQMAFTFRNDRVDQYYPGDDVIDWVGVDGYANIQCPWLRTGFNSFQQVFGKAIAWAQAHRKPLMIAEFNLREDPTDPQRKAAWLRSIAEEIRQTPTIKALVSFNSQESCAAVIETSEAAVEGYRDLGASPQLQAPSPAATPRPSRPEGTPPGTPSADG